LLACCILSTSLSPPRRDALTWKSNSHNLEDLDTIMRGR
jgi:hypothetical protein